MEVKLNKEIREYKEGVFFGLNLRQLVCSALAVGASVAAYFSLRGTVSDLLLGWICILLAAPFGFLGFFRYNGLTAERFFIAFVRDLRCPRNLVYRGENAVYERWKRQKGNERWVR